MADRYPAYYKSFRCSAGSCTDSCCRKWEIDIDEKSLARYRRDTGPLAQKLRESIVEEPDGTAHFRLTPEGNCPFLNEQGLCDMILQMGENALCQICTDHPRYYRQTGRVRECGVGLCCEEAAHLILNPSEDDRLIGAEEEKSELLTLRDTLLETMDGVVESWWADEFVWDEAVLQTVLAHLQEEEILSPLWSETLQKLSRKLPTLLETRTLSRWSPDFIRLGRYVTYRHFLRAEDYEEPEEGIFAARQLLFFCLTLVYLSYALQEEETGTLIAEDRINLCKLFSQEVEYDEEILEFLEDFAG